MTISKYAFYLPQFHPVPENNEWWGEGFTEWRNVVLSKPRFEGHRQPQIPKDLGFYDLRYSETMADQYSLAKKYGVDGFCVYHYWFHGKKILETPIENLVKNKYIEFPFFFCWANETWSRNWDGLEHHVLLKQEYSDADDDLHVEYIANLFESNNYVKINNKPIFVMYRPESHPNLDSFYGKLSSAAKLRDFDGVIFYGCYSGFNEVSEFKLPSFMDGMIGFQPNRKYFPEPSSINQKIIHGARNLIPDKLYQAIKSKSNVGKIVDYGGLVDYVVSKYEADWPSWLLPCVFPSWDNSPRRKTPTIIQNNYPELFGDWFRAARKLAEKQAEGIVFINAWNEWAEGCHLEPDLDFGDLFLRQINTIDY